MNEPLLRTIFLSNAWASFVAYLMFEDWFLHTYYPNALIGGCAYSCLQN